MHRKPLVKSNFVCVLRVGDGYYYSYNRWHWPPDAFKYRPFDWRKLNKGTKLYEKCEGMIQELAPGEFYEFTL